MCGMGVQDVTLPKGLIQAAAPQCKAHFSSEKERPATAALPVLGFSPCAGYAIFFCFPLKNCETASSLSCPCRLTDRKCVFLHILAFASWVLHHLILDFFFLPLQLLLFISGFLRCFSTFLFPWFHSPFPDCVR